jgi:hypothetical protein
MTCSHNHSRGFSPFDWRATKGNPCPVCQRDDNNCSARTGDQAYHCRSEHSSVPNYRYVKDDVQGFGIFYPEDPEAIHNPDRPKASRAEPPKPKPRPYREPKDWPKEIEHLRSRSDQAAKLDALAAQLGVSVDSLHRLECCYIPKLLIGGEFTIPDACMAFPERDSTGTPIGINRRFDDGAKRSLGKRGLTYDPDNWQDGLGPIYIVEGGSDVAAFDDVNLRAIGRPSATGGVDHLIPLLRTLPPTDRTVVVLGENDRRMQAGDVELWPGKDGAEQVARQLAFALPGFTIATAMPPEGVKDARAWVAGRISPAQREGVAEEIITYTMNVMVIVESTQTAPVTQSAESAHDGARNSAVPQAGLERVAEAFAALPPREIPIKTTSIEERLQEAMQLISQPPPACHCQRNTGVFYRGIENPGDIMFGRFACKSWDCPVCRPRNAHAWSESLILHILQAEKAGLQLFMVDTKIDGKRNLQAQVRSRGGLYARLETGPGIGGCPDCRFIVALPLNAAPLTGFIAVLCAAEEAISFIVQWASKVRTWDGPMAKKRPFHAVTTCPQWRLPKDKRPKKWKRVSSGMAKMESTITEVLDRHGLAKRYRFVDSIEGCDTLIWRIDFSIPEEWTEERFERFFLELISAEDKAYRVPIPVGDNVFDTIPA